MIPGVTSYCSDLIFVHMGENDLGLRSRHRILSDLLTFVDELARLCISHIIIDSQLMHFPVNMYRFLYDDFVDEQLNNIMASLGGIIDSIH